jgi:hypothetical protein
LYIDEVLLIHSFFDSKHTPASHKLKPEFIQEEQHLVANDGAHAA